jgi:hypothetical protein
MPNTICRSMGSVRHLGKSTTRPLLPFDVFGVDREVSQCANLSH